MNRAVVFLNIDRVLSRPGSRALSHRPLFEGWWRFRADVDVVITGELRLTQSLERLRSCFQADVRKRVIGATPAMSNGTRQREIDAWRTHYGHVGAFAVLDHAAIEFERDWPHLVLVGSEGLSARDLVLVDHVLREPAGGRKGAPREAGRLGRLASLGGKWLL